MKHFIRIAAVIWALVTSQAYAQWVLTGPYGVNVSTLAVSGSNLFVGTFGVVDLFGGAYYGGGVFLSTNNGPSWTAVNNGLPTYTTVLAFAVSGSNLFTGIYGGGVWRRPLSELVSVRETFSELPSAFSRAELSQSFQPNHDD